MNREVSAEKSHTSNSKSPVARNNNAASFGNPLNVTGPLSIKGQYVGR